MDTQNPIFGFSKTRTLWEDSMNICKTQELNDFDKLKVLEQELQDAQTRLQDQIQKIVDSIPNDNPKVTFKVATDGITLTHIDNDLVTFSCINLSDITSQDNIQKRVREFLDKF